MFYYIVESSHWPGQLEFRSDICLDVGQCFRIINHSGLNYYPTRFKVVSVSGDPTYTGKIVEIHSVDLNVEPF